MGISVEGQFLSAYTANADLSAKQFYAVKLSAGQIALCGDGEQAIGILVNEPTSGQAANVRLFGAGNVQKAIFGAATSAGDELAVDSAGKLITAISGDYVVGIGITAATATGDIREILLQGPSLASLSTAATSISIPIPAMTGIPTGDLVTDFTPGYAGRIIALEFICTTAVTTGSKSGTVLAHVGTVAATGTLALAGAYALGAVQRQAVSALNTFVATDTLSIVTAATTAFSEGAGVLLIHIDRVVGAAN